jgi:transposase-like protein
MDERQLKAERWRRSGAEMKELMAAYEGSGLSAQEFCEQHGLARSTLYRHRRTQGTDKAVAGKRWVRVELPAANRVAEQSAGSTLTIVVASGRRIEVKGGFDAQALERLIGLLERV